MFRAIAITGLSLNVASILFSFDLSTGSAGSDAVACLDGLGDGVRFGEEW
jgi:hypothetical protein